MLIRRCLEIASTYRGFRVSEVCLFACLFLIADLPRFPSQEGAEDEQQALDAVEGVDEVGGVGRVASVILPDGQDVSVHARL